MKIGDGSDSTQLDQTLVAAVSMLPAGSSPGTAPEPLRGLRVVLPTATTEATMPIILWLLGVPLSLVILLVLVGVV